jgi:hypothetical protein
LPSVPARCRYRRQSLPLPAWRRTPSRLCTSLPLEGLLRRRCPFPSQTWARTTIPAIPDEGTSLTAAFHGIRIGREGKERERGREGEESFWVGVAVSGGFGVHGPRVGTHYANTLLVGRGRMGCKASPPPPPHPTHPARRLGTGCILHIKYTQVHYIHTVYIYNPIYSRVYLLRRSKPHFTYVYIPIYQLEYVNIPKIGFIKVITMKTFQWNS